jgi:hypothetical protein
VHRTELEHLEERTVFSYACLTEQGTAGGREPDGQRHQSHRDGQHDQENGGDNDVEDALPDAGRTHDDRLAQADEWNPSDHWSGPDERQEKKPERS